MNVRLIERSIVVAAIPHDDIGFLLGGTQNALVVNTGIDNDAAVNMGLEFLALLDSAFMQI